MKAFILISIVSAVSIAAPAFAETCTGSGYTYVGNAHGGEFEGGEYYQGEDAEKIVMQHGYEEDRGTDMGLMSNDGDVSIDFNSDGTITATVFVTRQNGSAQQFILNCR
jgi:hypothetical protein